MTPRDGTREALNTFWDRGIEIIVWTGRTETADELADWMDEHKLPYDHINVNPYQVTTTRKIQADMFLDDRGENDPEAPWPDIVKIVLKRAGHRHGQRVCHYVITGYSGAGKSTLAHKLSKATGRPIVKLDDDRLWRMNKDLADDPERYVPGTKACKRYRHLLKKLCRHALKSKKPAILEGCQFLISPGTLRGHRIIVVDADENTVIRQRLKRDASEGKIDRDGKRARIDKAKYLYRTHHPIVESLKRLGDVEVVRPPDMDRWISGQVRRRRPIRHAKADWQKYTGPSGGQGWKNSITGEIRYQTEQPGDGDGTPTAPGKPVAGPKPPEHGTPTMKEYTVPESSLSPLEAAYQDYKLASSTYGKDSVQAEEAWDQYQAAIAAQALGEVEEPEEEVELMSPQESADDAFQQYLDISEVHGSESAEADKAYKAYQTALLELAKDIGKKSDPLATAEAVAYEKLAHAKEQFGEGSPEVKAAEADYYHAWFAKSNAEKQKKEAHDIAQTAATKAVEQAADPLPKNGLGIDVTKWSQTHKTAKWAAKKIAQMEKLAAEGNWDELEKIKFVTAKKTNNYQQACIKAYELLKQQHEAETPAITSTAGWTQTGGQLGGNPGMQMVDPKTGKKYYVKFSKSPDHAAIEVLSGKLYELAGAAVPELNLVETPEGLGVAGAWLEGELTGLDVNTLNDNAIWKLSVQENFAVHAWLANWDCVGDNFPNQIMIEHADGHTGFATVDVGGSMLYGGIGAKKQFTEDVIEWSGLRNPSINPKAAQVFKSMTAQQLVDSAQKLANISDDAINTLVDKYAPKGKAAELKKVLKARRDKIADYASGLEVSYGLTPTPAAPVKPKTLEQAVTDAVHPPVPPAPPAKPQALAAYNQWAFDSLEKAGETGNLAYLEGYLESMLKSVGANPVGDQKQMLEYATKWVAILKPGGGGPPALTMTVGGGKPATPAAKPAKTPKPPKPPKIKPADFPAIPKFESGNIINVAQNKQAAQDMLDIAATGDMDKLTAFAVPPSPKLQEWKNSLVAELHNQLHPPKPPKPYKGALGKLTKVYKNPAEAKKAGCQQIGFYSVVEEPGVPKDVSFPMIVLKAKKDLNGHYLLTDKDMQKQHDQAFQSMSTGVQDKLMHYTGSGSGHMNDGFHLDKSYKEAAMAKEILEKSPEIPSGTRLWRKIHLDQSIRTNLKNSVGKVVQEPAFSSCTINEAKRSGNVVWNYTASPGTRGIYVESFTEVNGEEEMILPPGARKLITAAKEDPNTGILYVDAILLATTSGQCC